MLGFSARSNPSSEGNRKTFTTGTSKQPYDSTKNLGIELDVNGKSVDNHNTYQLDCNKSDTNRSAITADKPKEYTLRQTMSAPLLNDRTILQQNDSNSKQPLSQNVTLASSSHQSMDVKQLFPRLLNHMLAAKDRYQRNRALRLVQLYLSKQPAPERIDAESGEEVSNLHDNASGSLIDVVVPGRDDSLVPALHPSVIDGYEPVAVAINGSCPSVLPTLNDSSPSVDEGSGSLTGTDSTAIFRPHGGRPDPPPGEDSLGMELGKFSTESDERARRTNVIYQGDSNISIIILLVGGASAAALIAALAISHVQKLRRMHVQNHVRQWQHLNKIDHGRLYGPGNGNGLIAE